MTAALIRPVSPFAAATLAPLPLLGLAAVLGGGWALLALAYMTLLRLSLDSLIATAGPGAAPGAEFPAAERLSQGLGIAHFPVLGLGVAAVSGVTGLGFWDGFAAFLAFGMYLGQVSTSNAHELIHRTDRFQFTLGKWVLISLLYGHHVTAHLKVHHRFVATPDDPNTAYLGQGFYEFLGQAWAGAFRAGWEIEQSAARISGQALPWWRHPYAEYLIGGAVFALASVIAFGLSGLIAFLLLAGYAQLQLILSDYVQHYGLRRRRVGDDGWEAVAPWHSWNAAHWFSGGLMLNAPRHSEHHTNPAVPYPELGLPDHMEGPRLPKSLPTMAAAALIPPLWHRMMDRRAKAWQARIDDAAIRRSPRLPPTPAAVPVPPAEQAGAPAAKGARPGRPGKAAAAAAGGLPDTPQIDLAALAATAAATDVDAGGDTGTDVPGSGGPGKSDAPPVQPRPRPRSARGLRRPEEAAEAPQAASAALWNAASDPAARVDAAMASDKDPAADPFGPAPTARFVRSSALFTSDEPDELAAPKDGQPATGTGHPEAADVVPADVEATIAELVQTSRTETRRRRAQFPTIEPDEADRDGTGAHRARALAGAGRLAARALAALLRGAPPGGARAGD
jgi:alkane 1-monooxygenase